MKKLAVFVSGKGSIMEAMIRAGLPISLVLADRPCRAVEIAREAVIPTETLERSFGKTFDRGEYSLSLLAVIERHHIEVIAMAGFMTVLAPAFFEKFNGTVLNTHPSLLPAFKGAHAVEDALRAKATVTGCTIHVATAELDSGPILAQEAVPILPGDTTASLHERIKAVERVLYPKAARRVLES